MVTGMQGTYAHPNESYNACILIFVQCEIKSVISHSFGIKYIKLDFDVFLTSLIIGDV